MTKPLPTFEVRDFDDPAEADEIVAGDVACFHLERMGDSEVWIGIDTADGRHHHINLWVEHGRLLMRCELDA